MLLCMCLTIKYDRVTKVGKAAKTFTLLLLSMLLLCACGAQPDAVDVIKTESLIPAEISEPEQISKPDIMELIRNSIIENKQKLNSVSETVGYKNISEFCDWIEKKFGSGALLKLAEAIKAKDKITSEDIRQATGYGVYALADIYNGRLDPESENYNKNIIDLGNTDDGIVEIGFTGDVSLAESTSIMYRYDSAKKGVEGILDSRILEIMRSMDVMVSNNEFTLSTRGSPIPTKEYTFRGKPERVNIWHEMGVDLVSLANNHSYDYGLDSFLDTLDTLDKAGIRRMGAGRNIDEANDPIYYIVNGYKIAFCAATRAEKRVFTPKAEENKPGVMYTYNTTDFCAEIAEAKKQSDFVFVYVHWGYEYTTRLEAAQVNGAKDFIDSGADAVIGVHAHILQGITSYKDKMVFYNLGNFIFNRKSIATGLLKVQISADGALSYHFIPCYQENAYTRLCVGNDYNSVLDLMRSISPNIDISDEGIVTIKKK